MLSSSELFEKYKETISKDIKDIWKDNHHLYNWIKEFGAFIVTSFFFIIISCILCLIMEGWFEENQYNSSFAHFIIDSLQNNGVIYGVLWILELYLFVSGLLLLTNVIGKHRIGDERIRRYCFGIESKVLLLGGKRDNYFELTFDIADNDIDKCIDGLKAKIATINDVLYKTKHERWDIAVTVLAGIFTMAVCFLNNVASLAFIIECALLIYILMTYKSQLLVKPSLEIDSVIYEMMLQDLYDLRIKRSQIEPKKKNDVVIQDNAMANASLNQSAETACNEEKVMNNSEHDLEPK